MNIHLLFLSTATRDKKQKDKGESGFRALHLILTSILLSVLCLTGTFAYAQNTTSFSTVFSDDFDDNSLNTTKWTTYLTGSSSFQETGGETYFTTNNGYSILKSTVFKITKWENISFSGKWKFTTPNTAEMRFDIYDNDTNNYVGVHYATWTDYAHEHIRYYYNSSQRTDTNRVIPRNYVTFKIILYNNSIQYLENNISIKNISTTALSNTTNFKIQLGGYDASSGAQNMYFDDIVIVATIMPSEITIHSPEPEAFYNKSIIWLNVTSDKEIAAWWYSLDGGENTSFAPNTTITPGEGAHAIVVYANDTSGNIWQSSVSFEIDTTPPGSISDISSTSGINWINWNWANPSSNDFQCVLLYLGGSYFGCTINNFFNATNLNSLTYYTLSTQTMDYAGNINTTWENSTALTSAHINLIFPGNNYYSNINENISFIYNQTWNTTGLNCALYIDTEPYGTNTSVQANMNYTIHSNHSLSNGIHEWSINCTNGTLFVQSETRELIVVNLHKTVRAHSINSTALALTTFSPLSILSKTLQNHSSNSSKFALTTFPGQTNLSKTLQKHYSNSSEITLTTIQKLTSLGASIKNHSANSTKFTLTTFTKISTLSKTLHQHSVNSSHYQKQIISQGVELYAANSTLTVVDGKAQYNITIKNMGSVQDNYALNVSLPTGWNYSLSNSTVTLGSVENATIILNITAPVSEFVGNYNINLSAASQTYANISNSISLAAVVTKPDLMISVSDIILSNPNPVIGEFISITVIIHNTGGVYASNVTVELIIDDIPKDNRTLYFKANSENSTTFNWTSEAGMHTIKIKADPYNNIDELNETNNEAVVILNLPDLIVAGISWQPVNPNDGDTVTFTAIIKNNGTGNTTHGFYTRFYVDGNYLDYWGPYISGIGAGSEINITSAWTAASGDHIIRVVTDWANNAPETNETNNERIENLTRVEYPDLIVAGISWQPVNPNDGDTVTFTAAIKNNGTGNTTHSLRNYFYVDEVYIGYADVSSLGSGSSVNITGVWTAVSGDHMIKVFADINAQVPESNETNNERIENLTHVKYPDLIVAGVNYTPSSGIKSGDSVSFNATIKNTGNGSTIKCFNIEFYIDNVSIGTKQICGIDVNESKFVTGTWIAIVGTHIIKISADINSQIPESNKTNNEREEFLPAIEYPDLIVTNITYTPQVINNGDIVTFSAEIKNIGVGGMSNCFNTRFYMDENFIGDSPVCGLSVNESKNITNAWIASPGSHTIKVTADISNQITESNETNNEKTEVMSASIPYPDLIIANVSVSSDACDGGSTKINATIKNTGSNANNGFYIKYYVDGSYLATSYIASLNSNASVVSSVDWIPSPGSHNITADADYSNLVAESYENNNNKTEQFIIGYSDLEVVTIAFPAVISDGESIKINATLRNNGFCTRRGFYAAYYINDNYLTKEYISELSSNESVVKTLNLLAAPGGLNVTVRADYTNLTGESNENNNERNATLPYVGYADLVVSSITTPASNFSDGDAITLTAHVNNTGADTLRSFSVRFEINGSYIGSKTVSGLAGGSSVMVNQTWTAASGSYAVRVTADEYNTVIESNETNNELSNALAAIPNPDIIITNITWAPETGINDGDTMTFTAAVKNNGTGSTSREFSVRFEVNTGNYTYIGSKKVSGLSFGSSIMVNQTWTAGGGEKTVRAIADEYNTIPESDEDNNNLSQGPFEVFLANLVVTKVTWSPNNIGDSDNVAFTAVVKNTGAGNTSRDFLVFFSVNDINIGYQSVTGGIISGNSTNVTLNGVWLASLGTHTIKAVADKDNRIPEANESDNELSGIFNVTDKNPPSLVSIIPANGSIIKEAYNVTAVLSDGLGIGADLINSNISVKINGWLVSGAKTVPGDKLIFTPDVQFTNGSYEVNVTAVDNESNKRTILTSFIIDTAPPVINISTLIFNETTHSHENKEIIEGGYYETPVTILINAYDTYPKSISTKLNNYSFPNGGKISVDGNYSIIAQAEDRAGNSAVRIVNFTIDTPPDAPMGLGRIMQDNVTVLTWNANTEPDVAGYNVYRNGTKLNTDLITGITYMDFNITEGAGYNYNYQLSAVDLAVHESKLANVSPVYITLNNYGTLINGTGYLTRGFVDKINVSIENNGDFPINVNSASFELIDMFGNVCYTVTRGAFGIPAKQRWFIENNYMINENFTSKLRVVVNMSGGGSASSIFSVNVRNAQALPVSSPEVTLMEGYADKINIQFTNYGSASLAIDPQELDLYLKDANGTVIFHGKGISAGTEIMPDSTGNITCLIYTPLAVPNNLSLGDVHLEAVLPGHYYDSGWKPGSVFNANISAQVKYETVSPLTVYHGSLIRGAQSNFTISLLNQGTASMFVSPGYVKIYVKDLDGNVISQGTAQHPYTEVLPESTGEFKVNVYVPPETPDDIIIEAEINAACQNNICGMMPFNTVVSEQVTEPEYNANATTDKGIYNRGENVTIYGVVTSTADETPVPDAQIKIKISNSGFTREFYVYSDAGGKYNYTFKPLSYEAGKYVVSATHPVITAMEYDSGFEIIGLYMSPKNIILEMSQNTMRTIAAEVRNLGASAITGIHLEITDKNTTDGVNALVSPETFNLAPGEVRSFNMDVNSSLSDSGEKSFEIKALSSNGSVEISNLIVKLHTALPVARLEPAYIQTGVKTSSMEVKKVNITNTGYGVMNNVVLVRHSVPWISIISDSDMDSIGPGESRTFDILLNPDETVEAGIYEDNFEITSSNHQTINFPIRVFITPNATGDLRFIVKNSVGDPIPSAKVSIINQKNFNLAFDGQTDSGGESLFSNVPAGRYSYKVAIPGYDNVVDEATVEAGIGKKVNVVTSLSFLKVEWEVVPTVIQDKYEIKHTITYDTRAPVPYVKADKVSEYLYILPGESYYGQITLTNMNDAVSAFNATPVAFANSELVSIEFLVDNIPELKPGESITIPYVVKLATHHSPEVTACEEYKITFAYKWNTQCSYGVYEENGDFLFNVYALVPTDSITINIKASCVDAFKDTALCIADVACYVASGGACAALEVGIKAVSAPYRIKDCIDTASNCLNMENYCNGWQAGDCIQTFIGCIDVAIPLSSCINAVYDGAKCLAQDNCCETNPPAFPTGPPGGGGYDPYMFSGTGGGGGSGGGSGGSGGTGGGGPTAPVEPGDTHYILNAVSNAISNIGLPDLTLPSPWKKGKCKTSPETECINAKIEILQELTLERQAFDARLKLTNLRPDYDMTNLSVNINITDPEGNFANNLFFIKVTGMEGISGIENGTINGTIPINGSITINWQFIPTPGAGGNTSGGVKYAVTASINYSVKNIPFETGTWPDEITVEPMPLLTLDYFLPYTVYGDDLMTVGVKEPVIPFMFGVRINNSGYGPARNLAIDSAQPRIVSSTPGANLEFKLLGTWVNGNLIENTLKISFGNVPPGGCAVAGWQMTSSATGNFTNYTAGYTHSDALGGQATSLIKNLSTHVLVKEFINDLPGEDNMFDFLVDNTSDGIPDLIYDSRCNDKPIQYVSLDFNETPSYEMPAAGLKLNGSGSGGWVYADGIDPLDNGREISGIIRSDGKILDRSNYWLGGGKLQLVDYGTTGNYMVKFIFPPKYSDLIVTKLNYTPDSPAEGDNVTITAAVNNSGNTSINLDEVNVSINVSNNFFGWKVVNLTNKTGVYVNFTWTAVLGEHNITVAVDPENDVNESNETNNEMISEILVSNINPDLTVAGVTLNPANTVLGQFTYITAAIRNLQNINLNLDNINISINISGNGNSWQVTDLTNKTEINVTFNWTAVTGEHNITVEVDQGNLIVETNETNNKLSVNITVFECYVNSTCFDNQFCDTSTHSCQNLTCQEGYSPENHVCVLNETYCFSDNNCSGSQNCGVTNHTCWQLDCANDSEAFNHRCYGKCDIDHNGIIAHDYGDLMAAYKCFSGVNENCNASRYQDWNSIKKEYKCFVDAR